MKLEPLDRPLSIPVVTSDCCVRCGALFLAGEITAVVRGGPAAKYRDVAIHVHGDCQQDAALDVGLAITVYIPIAGMGSAWLAPLIAGPCGEGFVRLNWLDDGTWRIGLHRGHAEIWSAKERDDHIARWPKPIGAYSPNGWYSAEPLGPNWRRVTRTSWLDLAKATPMIPTMPSAKGVH